MKSHVSIEQNVCPVCCTTHDIGVLLDRTLKDTLERNTVTGWGLCPDCDKKREDGYVALVEVDESKSTGTKPDEVHRLGRIVHVKMASETPLMWITTEQLEEMLNER